MAFKEEESIFFLVTWQCINEILTDDISLLEINVITQVQSLSTVQQVTASCVKIKTTGVIS